MYLSHKYGLLLWQLVFLVLSQLSLLHAVTHLTLKLFELGPQVLIDLP